jgi:hypothetical protein
MRTPLTDHSFSSAAFHIKQYIPNQAIFVDGGHGAGAVALNTYD